MDLEYAMRKKKWCIVLGAFGFCYGAYRVYTLRSLVKKRQTCFSAFFSLAQMVSHSADAIGILSKDLNQFLASDSDHTPHSFKQLSKIAKSNEFSDSLTRITRALAVGILNGNGLSDKVLDKLFSEAGSGFASVVVGSFAKNLAMALYSEWQRHNLESDWVEFACGDKCRELIGDVIRPFVSTAVTVYLDKTKHINTFDEFFDGLTNPEHEGRVKDMVVCVCNGAVETGVQTSYDVLSNKSKLGFEDGFKGKKVRESGGLVRKMCSTLGVPAYRKLVLDVAGIVGIVSFESIRSFIEFLLEKVLECINVVHHQVVDRGVETIRYASGISFVVSSVCLNILNSPWILVPC